VHPTEQLTGRATSAFAAAVAVIGPLVAAFASSSAMVWFRSNVVGTPDPRTEPFVLVASQRWTAAFAALLAALCLTKLAALPNDRQLFIPRLSSPGMLVAIPAFAGVVLLNLRYAGVQQGLWDFWWPSIRHAYFPLVALFTIGSLAALGIRALRTMTRQGVLISCLLGVSYGGFSSLWHCCAALWQSQDTPWPLAVAALIPWALAIGAFPLAAALRCRAPVSYVVAAVLFAVGYPWHTPLWFLQGLLGGAFWVHLSRRTGSLLSPGLFLSCAYLIHTTVPFLGV
jgi:hypothetical protein